MERRCGSNFWTGGCEEEGRAIAPSFPPERADKEASTHAKDILPHGLAHAIGSQIVAPFSFEQLRVVDHLVAIMRKATIVAAGANHERAAVGAQAAASARSVLLRIGENATGKSGTGR